MGDDVAELARDPRAFLRDQGLHPFLALPLELLGSGAKHLELELSAAHRAPAEPGTPIWLSAR